MKAMIEEKAFAEKKIRKITENEPKEKAMHEKQVEFMKQIEKRYQEVCQSTNTEVGAKITQNKDDGLYVVNILNKPKVETIEGQVFSLDHPDLVPDKITEEQFKQLREKVGLIHKSVRIDMKGQNIKAKKTHLDDAMTDKTIKKLGRRSVTLQTACSKKRKNCMSSSLTRSRRCTKNCQAKRSLRLWRAA